NSTATHTLVTGCRLALLDSTLDLGGNHLCYFAYVDKGVISGNTLSRPPFGRHALRLCGLSETQITNNVYISNNRISGWIDPISTGDAHNGGGKNYNWLLVHFAPNENSLKPAENIVFENNTVVDGQCLLNVGSAENVEIRDNLFSTVDASDVPRFLIGSIHGYDRKPSKNIRITGNLITSSSATSKSPILRISNYTGEAYNSQTQHEALAFNGNTIFMANPQAAYLSVGAKTQPLLGAVSTDHNLLYRSNDANAVLISPADYYKLAQWRLLSGNDVQSNVETTPQVPVPGFISAPRWISAGPLTVTYGAAQDFSGSGIKAVRLWAQRGDGLWFDTGLSSTHPEGTFTFQGFTGPDPYQFALAVEDHLGVTSFTPSGAGQLARTIYTGPPTVPDIMPPSAGTISAPAQATSGPIVISYAGAADNSGGSGLRQIRLWARKGLQGAWNDTGLYASSPTGSFSYEGMTGNDTYYFSLRAVDNSGNTSPVPTGNGNASTVFEAPLPSATDKLLHLPMNDDPAQGARDVSSLAQNGICSGATAPASSPEGRFDAAYAFDGADDYIGVNHLAGHVSNAFSLTLWIKAPPIYMYASSASNRKGSLLGINSSTGANLFALYVGGNSASINNKLCVLDGGTNTFVAPTPVTVADDAWHFIAYTSDGSTGYVYVDGFLMSSHAVNYKLAASNQWSIGQEFDGTAMNHFFQGLMDEYAVWNRVLSQQEISLLFANAPAWVDTSILSAGTLTIPAFASGTSIALSYAGASGGSNGLKRVRLYARKDSGSWVD
ncbi:MAG TPA: LamG domain-containing protein, partial [Candidatus Hydrogenedentes bacterium]|nr:LamG domain-containing protein [Candidatus Hydrogenedentota bacterium]